MIKIVFNKYMLKRLFNINYSINVLIFKTKLYNQFYILGLSATTAVLLYYCSFPTQHFSITVLHL
jgi:uncharacterized membrane protein